MFSKLRDKITRDLHLKDLLKGSAITFVLKMAGMGLGYGLILIVSRKLGAEGVGFYNVMMQILTVLGMVLGLGMNTSVLRYVGQFNNYKDRPKMRKLYRYVVYTVGPLTIVFSIILYFSAAWIIDNLGKSPEYTTGLKLVAIALPFFTLNQISVEFIRGLKKLHISELIRSVLRPLFISGGIFLFFWKDLSKIDIIGLMVFAVIINALLSRLTIWRSLSGFVNDSGEFYRKHLFKTSYPMLMTGISSTLMTASPIFFLDYFSGQADAGVFSITFRLASLVAVVLLIINTVAAPKIAELYWQKKHSELQLLIRHSAKIMFWCALILSVFLILFGGFLLSLFGSQFLVGYWSLVILTIGQFINAATGSVGVFMNMSGRQKTLNYVFLLFTLCMIMSFLILGQKVDLTTASICYSSFLSIINIVLFIYLNQTTNLRFLYFQKPT